MAIFGISLTAPRHLNVSLKTPQRMYKAIRVYVLCSTGDTRGRRVCYMFIFIFYTYIAIVVSDVKLMIDVPFARARLRHVNHNRILYVTVYGGTFVYLIVLAALCINGGEINVFLVTSACAVYTSTDIRRQRMYNFNEVSHICEIQSINKMSIFIILILSIEDFLN